MEWLLLEREPKGIRPTLNVVALHQQRRTSLKGLFLFFLLFFSAVTSVVMSTARLGQQVLSKGGCVKTFHFRVEECFQGEEYPGGVSPVSIVDCIEALKTIECFVEGSACEV